MTKLSIVYQDEHIIICNKAPGVLSASDKSFSVDLLSQVKTYMAENNREPSVHIINRLDRPVGGLVLFATDKKTASLLSALSGEHSIEKKYFAIVQGTTKERDTFKDYLLKDAKNNTSKVVPEGTKDARLASLSYTTIETKEIDGQVYSLVEIKLHTGRHHQIRTQFASRGLGLYGDTKYNKSFEGARNVMPMLFSHSLAFNNPYGAERIEVSVMPEGAIWQSFEYFR